MHAPTRQESAGSVGSKRIPTTDTRLTTLRPLAHPSPFVNLQIPPMDSGLPAAFVGLPTLRVSSSSVSGMYFIIFEMLSI